MAYEFWLGDYAERKAASLQRLADKLVNTKTSKVKDHMQEKADIWKGKK